MCPRNIVFFRGHPIYIVISQPRGAFSIQNLQHFKLHN
jgi:hypothetical protein